jgi:hypothetical protein
VLKLECTSVRELYLMRSRSGHRVS